MSEIKVNSIKGVAASSAAITVNNTDGTATANLTTVNSVTMPNGGFLSNRNLIINGAMTIAQRGTSSTTNVYGSVDRFAVVSSNVDEAPTQAQVDVASGTTPYSLGFRKAFKITNGNQTSGFGSTDSIEFRYRVESQDVANSGWNYTDQNSFITLSFWVKSSVSFNMKGYFFTHDNSYNYPLETGTLTADTWTKITKTIPGNSNLVFNNDNGEGISISFGVYGTFFSSGNPSVNQWVAYSSATLTNPSASTWYTTNDATLEFTGMQLEVGSVATDFEHRSFAVEERLCQRYYYKQATVFYGFFGYGTNSGTNMMGNLIQPCVMRTQPTVTVSAGSYWASGPTAGGSGPFYSYVYGTTSSSNGPNLLNYQLDAEL
jgi:hypothetical protein